MNAKMGGKAMDAREFDQFSGPGLGCIQFFS